MNTPYNADRGLLILLALLLSTAACDSGGDNQAAFPQVAGTYVFSQMVLFRGEATLTATIKKTVKLQALSSKYAGLTAIP